LLVLEALNTALQLRLVVVVDDDVEFVGVLLREFKTLDVPRVEGIGIDGGNGDGLFGGRHKVMS